MIHRRELSRAALRDRVPERTVEKDYAIHWLMAGLARTPLHARLAFKGGTALRLCRFQDYRYSEDVDLTALDRMDPHEAVAAFREAASWVREASALVLDPIEESVEAPEEGFGFEVAFQGPLGGAAGSRSIKIDVSTRERLRYPVETAPLIRHYEDLPVDAGIRTYSLEEVVVEKFRSLLNPARREPRDVYDLVRLTEASGVAVEDLGTAFREKAAFKGLDPDALGATLARKEKALAALWERRLAHQVAELPPFDASFRTVLREARKLLG